MSDPDVRDNHAFDDSRRVARGGSSEVVSPTAHGRKTSGDAERKKKSWRKSLDQAVVMVGKNTMRGRTGSWNLGKERPESTRRERPLRRSASRQNSAEPSPERDVTAQVLRSGSLPSDKVSSVDSWESLEIEAEQMAAEQHSKPDDEHEAWGPATNFEEPLPLEKVQRRKSETSASADSLGSIQVEGEEGEVKIRADAKTRVKQRKRGGTPRKHHHHHLELDLAALMEKTEGLDEKSVYMEGESDSPKRKVSRTQGGGFLSARGLDSIQIRKKTLNISNSLSSRKDARLIPARHAHSPPPTESSEFTLSSDDPLQTASWEAASQEVLDRRATKRDRILMELLMTERKFVSVLEAVVHFVLQPMRQNGILPEEDIDTIFANIEDIFVLNQSLLSGMESCLGKKRKRTGSKFIKDTSKAAALSGDIPSTELLPSAIVENLPHGESSPGRHADSPQPMPPRRLASSGSSRQNPEATSPSLLPTTAVSPSLGPCSPRSSGSCSPNSSGRDTPNSPRSPRSPSPRTLSSPRSPPPSPSVVVMDSSALPGLPTSPDVLASPTPAAPASPAPVLPKSKAAGSWAVRCTSLGELFVAYSERMSIHTEFCSNHSRLLAEKKLKKLREEYPGLGRFLETCLLRPECRGQTLEAMLITIPQRVCRYPMLLLELIKNTPPSNPDYALIAGAWKSVRDVVAEINADTEVASDFGALLDVQQVLQIHPSLGINLLQSHRKFLTRGVFKVSKSSNYAFLFNDCLILSKTRGEFYKAKRVIRLSKLILRATGPGGQPIKPGTYSIQLAEIGERIITVEFSAQQEMDQWVKYLQTAMSSCSADLVAQETVSRMSTTHALASTMASLVGPLSPRGILGGSSQHDLQKRKGLPKKVKRGRIRTMPRSLVSPTTTASSTGLSLSDSKEEIFAELERQSRHRKNAEAKLKELEAEMRSLKRLLGEKSMLVGALQGKLEKERAEQPTKKKRSAFNSTKSASNLLAEFGEALVDASPKKMKARMRRDEEQPAGGGIGRDSPLPKIERERSVVFPDSVSAGEEETSAETTPQKKGSTIIFGGKSSPEENCSAQAQATPPARHRSARNLTPDSRTSSPVTSLPPPRTMESMELQMQILHDKKEWEEKEAEKKKKRKHRISVSLLKI